MDNAVLLSFIICIIVQLWFKWFKSENKQFFFSNLTKFKRTEKERESLQQQQQQQPNKKIKITTFWIWLMIDNESMCFSLLFSLVLFKTNQQQQQQQEFEWWIVHTELWI